MSLSPSGATRLWLLVPLAIGVAYLAGALDLAPGSLESPGAGFFPLIAAAVLLVSTAVALLTRRSEETDDEGRGEGGGPPAVVEQDPPSAQTGSGNEGAGAGEEHGAQARDDDGGAGEEDAPQPWRVLAILGALAAYLLIASLAGHVLGAFVAAAIAIRALHARPWWQVALFAAMISALSYAIFALGLGVQLPAGDL